MFARISRRQVATATFRCIVPTRHRLFTSSSLFRNQPKPDDGSTDDPIDAISAAVPAGTSTAQPSATEPIDSTTPDPAAPPEDESRDRDRERERSRKPSSRSRLSGRDRTGQPTRPASFPAGRRVYGSSLRRSLRRAAESSRAESATAVVPVPEWFLRSNVTVNGPGEEGGSMAVWATGLTDPAEITIPVPASAVASVLTKPDGDVVPIGEPALFELVLSLLGAFDQTALGSTIWWKQAKPHVLVKFPLPGGDQLVKQYVDAAAAAVAADVVRIDPLDLAELFGPLTHGGESGLVAAVDQLGFDSYCGTPAAPEEPDEEEVVPRSRRSGRTAPDRIVGVVAIPSGDKLDELVRSGGLSQVMSMLRTGGIDGAEGGESGEGTDGIDAKTQQVDRFIDALLDAAVTKRKSESAETTTETRPSGRPTKTTRRTIVFVSDIHRIVEVEHGNRLASQLVGRIQERRQQGEQIVVVASSSSKLWPADSSEAVTDEAVRQVETVDSGIPFTGLFLAPTPSAPSGPVETMVESEENARWTRLQNRRNLEINTRHIVQTIGHMALSQRRPAITIDGSGKSDKSKVKVELPSVGELVEELSQSTAVDILSRRVWTAVELHRLVTFLCALGQSGVVVSADRIKTAASVIQLGTTTKQTWIRQFYDRTAGRNSSRSSGLSGRLAAIGKKANRYESQLLAGVIDPANIHASFESVHAPDRTIEAVQMLTTLSLSKPDEFQYGVLKHENLTGLLLYGPPGVGKTLLAKAVAKASKATVLEVSGSEINDMYIGESEKNVKAIFSLARKLSPCVVFLDEADAVLASRANNKHRNGHRETINQFLKEWDGVGDHRVFLMVATNRPFDLDDAVLRRLPRRLLVDLPTLEDRAAILRIHLRDEQVDQSVDLAVLAANTPFYSGSDLKNLCVAAALACVKESLVSPSTASSAAPSSSASSDSSVDSSSSSPSSSDSAAPVASRRILTQAHFDKATSEIGASVSEDMSSLRAIRKFDEQYGEKRGRRSRRPVWGFGLDDGVVSDVGSSTASSRRQVDEDSVRVRAQRWN